MSASSRTTSTERLAVEGGEPAVRHPLPPMYPGGMRIGTEEEAAVLEVLRSRRLFRYYGPEPGPSRVEELEEAFAHHVGARHALAVSSGTAALTASLAALGVGPGDEVIVPAYTWISTAAAVLSVGAVPVVAEVDDSLTLDPEDVERRITKRTRVVIPVHMRGAPCNMDGLGEVARRHGLRMLEDVAQAVGGSYRGRRLGTIGEVGAFSLQFNKIITSGEGGLVTTDDGALHERAQMYHDVAASQRPGPGAGEAFVATTCRMGELAGAVALAQLGKLEGLLAGMRANKARIVGGVEEAARSRGFALRREHDPEGDTGIALVLLAPTREVAAWTVEALRAEGVGADVLFDPSRPDYHVYYHWTPVLEGRWWHPTSPWKLRGGEVGFSRDSCPRTLELLGRAVHLDVSPELTEEQVGEVILAINKVLSHAQHAGG